MTRPAGRGDFEIAIICALTIEADAAEALFDRHWGDEGPPYDKAPGDPNAYSTGYIGRHNVVLAHMPGIGKANAALVASNCRNSFPNIKLALVVGVCGAAPFAPSNNDEIVLGDVIISDGVIQYDLGRRLPEGFVRKDTLLDSLGRPNAEIRALVVKLKGIRGQATLKRKMASYMEELQKQPEVKAEYPGLQHDRLFEATYRHVGDGMICEDCCCSGRLVSRSRLAQGIPQPAVHFGLIATGDMVMKSGEERDEIVRREGAIGFEMEGAGVWDSFPCVVIKGVCDYADSHKTKVWQRYAAATAAACMKSFLDYWVPSVTIGRVQEHPTGPWLLIPLPRHDAGVGRGAMPVGTLQAMAPLVGLGGMGGFRVAFPNEGTIFGAANCGSTRLKEVHLDARDMMPRIADTHFDKILDIMRPKRSPENALQKHKSIARRSSPWRSQNRDTLELLRRVGQWASAPKSSLLVLQTQPRAHARVKEMAIELIGFLRPQSPKVIWYLSGTSIEDKCASAVEVLRSLIFQSLKLVPELVASELGSFSTTKLRAAHSENEWLDLLCSILQHLNSCFIIIEAEDVFRNGGSVQLMGLLQRIADRFRDSGAAIKLLVVSYNHTWPSPDESRQRLAKRQWLRCAAGRRGLKLQIGDRR
ncbi:hypothetical protein RB601_000293 [Gaeumannomyces tritici]